MSRQLQFLQYGNKAYATDMSWVGAWDEEPATPRVMDKVCPELKKLDELDQQENNLGKELAGRLITEQQYRSLLAVINHKRDTLTKKLEKSGYFPEEELQEHTDQVEPCQGSELLDGFKRVVLLTSILLAVFVTMLTAGVFV